MSNKQEALKKKLDGKESKISADKRREHQIIRERERQIALAELRKVAN